VLTDVLASELFELWELARAAGLATPNIGTINDMICCPGGDYCSLANAKSIPVAEAIQRKFDDLDYVYDLGDLELNISGCMNACGHHHIGHIGILGVDKKGEEWYQIQIGGSASKDAALAKVLGPSLSREAVTDSVEKLLDVYVENRLEGETFLAAYQRIGIDKFKERVYAPTA
jgi:sulfite reductase (NADPH) hemoprotein beta-component